MEIIHQGKPGRKYFLIVRPYPTDPKQVTPGDKLLLRHPRTGAEHTVAVSDRHWWVWQWTDVPDSFCLLNFGISSIDLKTYLEQTHLEFRGLKEVKFMMVEETN